MKDLTVIIPIQSLDSDVKKSLFSKAICSVGTDTAIILVGDAGIFEDRAITENCNTVICEKGTNFSAQVNLAVKSVKTKYFSVLEPTDTYSDIWLKNVERYIANDTENTFVFLPLTEVVDFNSRETLGYANEAFWASSFSDEIGWLDIESLKDYLNFNMSGAVLKTDEFTRIGGLKASMKLTYWMEFLLRALYKEKKAYVIPKVGCYHTVNTGCETETVSAKEADWWIELAKKEYFFPHDRNKVYEEE